MSDFPVRGECCNGHVQLVVVSYSLSIGMLCTPFVDLLYSDDTHVA